MKERGERKTKGFNLRSRYLPKYWTLIVSIKKKSESFQEEIPQKISKKSKKVIERESEDKRFQSEKPIFAKILDSHRLHPQLRPSFKSLLIFPNLSDLNIFSPGVSNGPFA